MKLMLSQHKDLRPNYILDQYPSTPTKHTSRSKSKGRKSLQVTSRNGSCSKPKIQIKAPAKFHKLIAQTPNQRKRSYIDDIVCKFGSIQSSKHKIQTTKHKNIKNLLLLTDIVDYNSMATMDSFQMKKSKVSSLWNCDSPVNNLIELQESNQEQSWLYKYFK